MSCSHLKSCPLFAQFALHPALSLWQDHYCNGEYKVCARYGASLKGKAVPVTLLPNGKLLEVKNADESLRGGVLFNAVLNNRVWMLENLINRVGVDKDFQNVEGMSALMVAAENGLVDMVRILLEAGAEIRLKNIGGETAYDLALKNGHLECADILRKGTSGRSAASPAQKTA